VSDNPLAGAAEIDQTDVVTRVVVIEDHADTADLMDEILRQAGHQVAIAHNGADGIAAARRLSAEVVLCDVGLPDMDGYQVARTLRADAATKSAHMVALTGYDGEEEQRMARDAGFDRHVVKPIDPFKLESLLKR
jgi:CheY-like chemotaxis protein